MSTAIIVQARMGSSRLPGKVMKDLLGKTVLEHVVERLSQCRQAERIIIATSTLDQDEVIANHARKMGVDFFRGSEDDVLSRYYFAAKEFSADLITRVTADCPLVDPFITDEVISFYKKSEFDIVSNAGAEPSSRTFPRGFDTEVFSFKQLEKAFNNATERYQREHVTPYIYENAPQKYFYKGKRDFSALRLTLDTQEDFNMISTIYQHLYKGKHDFYFNDIVELLERFPDIKNINAHIEQKKVKESQC